MKQFESTFIPEDNLIFGGKKEEKDPRVGLKHFGPYHYEIEDLPLEKIKLGIIGNQESIQKAKDIIKKLKEANKSHHENKWLYPDYPGMTKTTKFQCEIEINPGKEETILDSEIKRLSNMLDVNERIGAAVELYKQKIQNLLEDDNPPAVIICSIPKEIEKECGISEKTRGAKKPKPTKLEREIQELKNQKQTFLADWGVTFIQKKQTPKSYDLRNALKGENMGLTPAIPLQLLRESTCDAILNHEPGKKSTREDPAAFCWNISTALFYKANGKPWRLAKLNQDTCYVGISFYKDKLNFNENIKTSMAQIFTHSGEGLVLRGDDVYVDEKTREPHLTRKQGYELLKDSINRYTNTTKKTPARVVLHKSTLFSKDEQEGFTQAIEELTKAKKDFVTISDRNHGIKVMRSGAYPVLRGTLMKIAENTYLQYTVGYIPRLRTYPGHNTPNPVMLTHIGESQIKEIAKEIQGLTKLNWNTTAFATYYPITLTFAKKVAEVLSELDKSKPIQSHYRYYM